ncbi:hypothetical protein ACWCHM_18600 [Micromonospora sp. SCSIO 07396]
MNPQVWSWLLMAVGVTGLYLAGRRSWTGWAVGLAGQTLWLAYSLITEQWGFLVSCFVYGAIYLRNLRAWLHPTPTTPTTPAPAAGRADTAPVPAPTAALPPHTGPVRCLTPACPRPATHWHDGAPRCEPCAWLVIDDEGRTNVEPAPGTTSDLAAYYLTRGLNPAPRTSPGEVTRCAAS